MRHSLCEVSTLLVLAYVGVQTPTLAEIRYHVSEIQFPSCFEPELPTTPMDINDAGFVGGALDGCHSEDGHIWNPGSGALLNLGSLGGCIDIGTTVKAINNRGHAIGEDPGQGCIVDSWFWTPEEGMVSLGDLPGGIFFSDVRAMNNLDQAVGYSDSASGSEAFLWDSVNGMVGLGDLAPYTRGSIALDVNDLGWAVGRCTQGAFLWTEELGMKTLAELTNEPVNPPDVNVVNNVGQLAGTDVWGVYVWDFAHGRQSIGVQFDGAYPHVTGTNDHGQIVGWSQTFIAFHTPFVWDEHHGFQAINELIDPCRSEVYRLGIRGNDAIRINNSGQICGQPVAGRPAFVLSPYIPGDLDENEVCDLQDLAIQLSNFARSGDADYAAGDLDCDQDVDLEDLAILLGNFGETLP